MLKFNNFLLTLTITFLFVFIATIEAADSDIVSFPYEKKPCTGKGLLGAVCCQGVLVNTIGFNKTLCVEFALKILPPKADVKIFLDDKKVAEFEIDPKKPPNFCIPVVLPVPVAMCLKLHDIKLIGLTALQICSTVYVNYETNQIFSHVLPCVKLSGTGIEKMKK